ncbi:MAG: ribose 1,5-bisphosphate isomerase, partial [Deltaproteobacteria bacterium]|nr:ribose 1,5-bisphosphate isomerase [Deltaproteobacteria bacterium]
MDPECRKIIAKIKSLDIQGATSVAKAALRCLEITTKKSKAKTRNAFLTELQLVGKGVIGARATEPTLRNAVTSVILRVKIHEDLKTIKKFTIHESKKYMDELNQMILEIADKGAGEISDGDVVLTHCHSKHVIEILKKAKRSGKKIEVIVTETRPRNQGILTAKELLDVGIKVTYCVDSAFGFVMKRVTKFM